VIVDGLDFGDSRHAQLIGGRTNKFVFWSTHRKLRCTIKGVKITNLKCGSSNEKRSRPGK